MMLREAKSVCDHLIVGLQVHRTPEPVQSIVERYIQLAAVQYVDEIIPYCTEGDLEDILESYPINIRILGEEYRNKDFTGRDICKRRGIEFYFNKRDHRFSSNGLRKLVRDKESGR